MVRGAWGLQSIGWQELDMTEQLNHQHHALGRGFYSHAAVTVLCPLWRHVFCSRVPRLCHLLELPGLPPSSRSIEVLPVFHQLI